MLNGEIHEPAVHPVPSPSAELAASLLGKTSDKLEMHRGQQEFVSY